MTGERADRSPTPAVRRGHGAAWLRDAYRMVSGARLPWLLLLFLYYLVLGLIDLVPFVGQIAAPMLKPVFAVGFLAAAWSQERGGTPEPKQLFQGFRSNLWALIPLGAFLVIGITLAVLGTAMVDDGKLLDVLSGKTQVRRRAAGRRPGAVCDAVRGRLRAAGDARAVVRAGAGRVPGLQRARRAALEPARLPRELAADRGLRPARVLLRRHRARHRQPP